MLGLLICIRTQGQVCSCLIQECSAGMQMPVWHPLKFGLSLFGHVAQAVRGHKSGSAGWGWAIWGFGGLERTRLR